MRVARIIRLLAAVALLVGACGNDDDGTSGTAAPPAVESATTTTAAGSIETTSTIASSGTDAAPTTATSGEEPDTTTVATGTVSGMPSYEVVHRLIEDGRETLVIVVESGSYSTVELENLVYDIVERFSPSEAIVVDTRTAADLAVLEERTDEEQATLDAQTFLRIESGVEVTFYGPYADFPGLTIGS